MQTILVVGGAGYIGSHMVWKLFDDGYDVIVLDNLSSGKKKLIPKDIQFIEGNLDDAKLLTNIFTNNKIDAVMHFAAFIEVGESQIDPAKYFQNNLIAPITLLNTMLEFDVRYFILSSTAAVYGEPEYTPIDTKHPTKPVNTYGRTKLMLEQVLADYDRAYGLKSVSLRYFNACGADPKGRSGECHDPETHLIPIILQVANGRRESIKVFGDDYDTRDGSCVRDYIHINDLCSAHELALQHLLETKHSKIYNLGNGQGYTVKEVIAAVEKVTGKKIKTEVAARRAGDPAVLIADANAIKDELGWKTEYPNLEDIIAHAWQWEQQCS